ncbi:MAG TPA: YciI family protein [Streptosporangiaceae bacterium]|nr:YciI family protein [Streptosporangiaceae bacterium]
MRFLMTTTAADPPDEKLIAEMDRLVEEMTRKGVLLAAGGLDPVGTRVTSSGGTITVTDGPFTEAKETILSFALVEARSKEEVIELSRRFWQIAGSGEGHIQQVYGPE